MKALQEYEDRVKVLEAMSDEKLLDEFAKEIWDCSYGSGNTIWPYLKELKVRLEHLQKHYKHTYGEECSICKDE